MTIKTFLFNQWRHADQQHALIKSLWGVIAVLVILNLFMWLGWKSAPDRIRVYLPPDLSSGALVTPGAIPKSTIYAFTYQIFTALNTWSDNGSDDYLKNINAYKHYFSEKFYQELLKDYSRRQTNSALNRQRIMTGVTGINYDEASITVLGNDAWKLDLRLHIVETVTGTVVKDVIMDYPLRVAKINASIQVNPWGMQIMGYEGAPYRVKTNI